VIVEGEGALWGWICQFGAYHCNQEDFATRFSLESL